MAFSSKAQQTTRGLILTRAQVSGQVQPQGKVLPRRDRHVEGVLRARQSAGAGGGREQGRDDDADDAAADAANDGEDGCEHAMKAPRCDDGDDGDEDFVEYVAFARSRRQETKR